MTPEEKEIAKRRVYPMLKLMSSVKELELAVLKMSLVVTKGEFSPDEVYMQLDGLIRDAEVRLRIGHSRVVDMLCHEALGPHTLHARAGWEDKLRRKVQSSRKRPA